MKFWFVTGTLLLSAFFALAQNKTPKSKMNTQLFEKEAEGATISGKVKVVREIQEETEVFIENPKGSTGPYVLPTNTKNRANLLKILNKSQKPGGPSVTLQIDGQQRITNVEATTTTPNPLEM